MGKSKYLIVLYLSNGSKQLRQLGDGSIYPPLKYKIVYENKSYYYCKKTGCSELIVYEKKYSRKCTCGIYYFATYDYYADKKIIEKRERTSSEEMVVKLEEYSKEIKEISDKIKDLTDQKNAISENIKSILMGANIESREIAPSYVYEINESKMGELNEK